ncbi:MAG TPA: DUF3987 domain-containing protein [Candidatus Acidoferrales bacterium]
MLIATQQQQEVTATPAVQGAIASLALNIPQTPIRTWGTESVGKAPFLPAWATDNLLTKPEMIYEAARKYPGCSFGSVAKAVKGAPFIIEVDGPELAAKFERETGRKFEFGARRTRSSPGRGHIYFLHTEKSLKLGNVGQDEIADCSVRAHNEQCITFGSPHYNKDGVIDGLYELISDVPITPAPDELIDWLAAQPRKSKEAKPTVDSPIGSRTSAKLSDEFINGPVKEGSIHTWSVSVAGHLRHKGLSPDEIFDELVDRLEKQAVGKDGGSFAARLNKGKLRAVADSSASWLTGEQKRLRDLPIIGLKTIDAEVALPAADTTEEFNLLKDYFSGGQTHKLSVLSNVITRITELKRMSQTVPTQEVQDSTDYSLIDESGYDHVMSAAEIEEEYKKEFPVFPIREVVGPTFDPSILYGPAGVLINKMCAYNEAHPLGMYLDLLVNIGNMCGRRPHFFVDKTRHGMVEFVARIGESSRSRKGTGRDVVDAFCQMIDMGWTLNRIVSNFGSGQAIIDQIRDAKTYSVKQRDDWVEKIKPGVSDKRLLIHEAELATLFVLAGQPNTSVDSLLRNFWDGKKVQNIVRGKDKDGVTEGATCAEPHVSITGDTTASELFDKMPDGADKNGFGNRFLFPYTYRVKLCPLGGPPIDWMEDVMYFHDVRGFSESLDEVPMTPAARQYWSRNYLREEKIRLPDLAGRMTSRGPAHIRRLALILTVIDMKKATDTIHLQAASRIWDYCRESARYVFGGVVKEQMSILKFLDTKGAEGASATEIVQQVFKKNKPVEWVRAQVGEIFKKGLIEKIPDSDRVVRSRSANQS